MHCYLTYSTQIGMIIIVVKGNFAKNKDISKWEKEITFLKSGSTDSNQRAGNGSHGTEIRSVDIKREVRSSR